MICSALNLIRCFSFIVSIQLFLYILPRSEFVCCAFFVWDLGFYVTVCCMLTFSVLIRTIHTMSLPVPVGCVTSYMQLLHNL